MVAAASGANGGKWTSTVIRHVGSRDSSLDRDELDSRSLLSTDDDEVDDQFGDDMSVEEDCWFEDWEQDLPQKHEVCLFQIGLFNMQGLKKRNICLQNQFL